LRGDWHSAGGSGDRGVGDDSVSIEEKFAGVNAEGGYGELAGWRSVASGEERISESRVMAGVLSRIV
jgi:hypothetical protein